VLGGGPSTSEKLGVRRRRIGTRGNGGTGIEGETRQVATPGITLIAYL